MRFKLLLQAVSFLEVRASVFLQRKVQSARETISDLLAEEAELSQQLNKLKKELTDREAQITQVAPLVFISYAREDEVSALNLYGKLLENGFRPWIDKKDLYPGEKWDRRIRKVMQDADFIIICLSKKSVQKRGFIQREIKIALDFAEEIPEGSVHTLPVRLDKCKIPSVVSEPHYVDLFDPEGFDKLKRSVVREWRHRCLST